MRCILFCMTALLHIGIVHAQYSSPLGGTSQSVMNTVIQNNANIMHYNKPSTSSVNDGTYYKQIEAARETHKKHLEETLSDYKRSATNNSFLKPVIPKLLRTTDTLTPNYRKKAPFYFYAYNELLDMLEGKKPLDLKKAVFITELSADTALQYSNYLHKISYWKSIVTNLLIQEKLPSTNSLAINYCIQKLFQDTLILKNTTTNKYEKILPFSYDFDDMFGENDIHKYMVNKLLMTRSGQCHSLPLLYLILANEFNAKAYIAYSPSHSFIVFEDGRGALANFETTTGYIGTRDIYLQTNLIKSEAIKNNIYLKPNTLRETIAACLVD